jgi:hypothetical protein
MEKDIDVFEKVVNELFRQQDAWTGFERGSASGTYVPGYGVIMQLPAGYMQVYYSGGWDDINGQVQQAMEYSRQAMEYSRKTLEESGWALKDLEKGLKDAPNLKEERKSKAPKAKGRNESGDHGTPVPEIPPAPASVEMKTGGKSSSYNYMYGGGGNNAAFDSARARKQVFIIGKMKLALQNYADLLTQLPANEKILMVYDEKATGGSGSNNTYAMYNSEGSNISYAGTAGPRKRFPKISAEVKKEEVNALRSGKINEKAFAEQVKTEVHQQKEEDFLDYKIFSGILETVFNHGDDMTFRIKGHVGFTYLPGFGVIYQARMRTSGRTVELTEEEKDEKKENARTAKLMEEMEKSLKAHLLDYGRTLRSLKDEQFILLNIDLPEEDAWPSGLSMKVKKDVLSKYEKGELTREKALEAITVSRHK